MLAKRYVRIDNRNPVFAGLGLSDDYKLQHTNLYFEKGKPGKSGGDNFNGKSAPLKIVMRVGSFLEIMTRVGVD